MSLRYNLNCPRLSPNCRKCYAKREDGTIDRSAYMTPCCYAVPCGIPSVVVLTYEYTDDWGRPTYKSANGLRFKDVNCGDGKPSIHTVTQAGEPDCPVHFEYSLVRKPEDEKVNVDRHGNRIKDGTVIRMKDGTMDYVATSTARYGLFTGHSLMQSPDGNFDVEIVTDPKELERFWDSRRIRD